jgi:hypothetical protein
MLKNSARSSKPKRSVILNVFCDSRADNVSTSAHSFRSASRSPAMGSPVLHVRGSSCAGLPKGIRISHFFSMGHGINPASPQFSLVIESDGATPAPVDWGTISGEKVCDLILFSGLLTAFRTGISFASWCPRGPANSTGQKLACRIQRTMCLRVYVI